VKDLSEEDLEGIDLEKIWNSEPVEPKGPKAGEIFFNSDNYLGIMALDPKKKQKEEDEEPPDYMIEWCADAKKFAGQLRAAANFIERHAKTKYFDVSID